jgi:hypothetical protein
MNCQHSAKTSTESRNRTVRGLAVTGELNALDGVWAGRIWVPGQKVKPSDRFTIHQAGFVRSLRPLLRMPLMTEVKPAVIALLLNAYWEGIAKVLPEPFDLAGNPNKYTIQKNQGAAVLHHVLPQVIEVIPSWGRSLVDPIAHADVMRDLPTLGDEIIISRGIMPVSGADFWLSGPAGVASKFSGDVGCKRLSAHVRALIPRPSEGLEI